MKIAIISPPLDVPGLKHSVKILKKILKNILEIKYQEIVEFTVLQGERQSFNENALKARDLTVPPELPDGFFDAAFFIETLYNNEELFKLSKKNIWIPHQEYVLPTYREPFKWLDDTWCITAETKACLERSLFTETPLTLSGWTSVSRKTAHPKNFKKFLHLAGNSFNKGSLKVLHVWEKNPHLPTLHFITRNPNNQAQYRPQGWPPNVKVHWLPSDDEVTELLNTCGVHLCTSITEGFGHYINEGLSTGAIVIGTNGPPMNEFYIQPVNIDEVKKHNYADAYFVCHNDLHMQVEKVLNFSPIEAREQSNKGSHDFFRRNENFINFVANYDFKNILA